tara:strand:- start:3887 stop:5893 length:2007 start_codon:yes stop_codon:yes gene_type:complete
MKKLLQVFIAIIPLIVSFSTSDPTLAIRFLMLSLLLSGVLVFYILSNKTIYQEIITHPLKVIFGIMILSYILSAFYNGFGSESIYIILKLFLAYIFTIILVHFIKDNGYQPLLNSFVFFSLLLSSIYFFQVITNYSDIIAIESEWKRNWEFDAIAATMGNKNLLSSIHFLLLPILIYVFIISKKALKILSAIAIFLMALTLIQTQTRAVLFAIGIFSISVFILNKNSLKKKHVIGLLLGGLIILSIGYSAVKLTNRYDAFVEEFNKTLDFKSSGRYKLYNSSFQLIKEQPLFGVGPGNWSVNIWKYGLYEGTLGKSFAQRPHSDFLWVFSEGGIVAGIAYILMFIILLKDSYFLHKNREETDGIFYSLLFSCFLGFGFISLVDFPLERFSHNIIFFLLASFIIAGKIKKTNKKTSYWFKLILLSISFFAVYVASIRYEGQIHSANAMNFKNKGKWNYLIKAIDKAYNKNYYEMEDTSTPLLWYRGVAYFNQQKYNLAFNDFQKAYQTNPYHVHVLNNLATSYQMKGNSEKAKYFYRQVFKVNPTFKESRVNLAAILYNEKKYVEALDVILKSKVKPYWKRKKQNIQDNYDLYLKTITKRWINSVFENSNVQEQKALEEWMSGFDKKPYYTSKKTKDIFNIRVNKNIDYLAALMQYEADLKEKKNKKTR